MERKIIRNAELNLEATTPEEARQKISAIAESKGGFVIESQQSSSDVKSVGRNKSRIEKNGKIISNFSGDSGRNRRLFFVSGK